jgi:hypothetical protein
MPSAGSFAFEEVSGSAPFAAFDAAAGEAAAAAGEAAGETFSAATGSDAGGGADLAATGAAAHDAMNMTIVVVNTAAAKTATARRARRERELSPTMLSSFMYCLVVYLRRRKEQVTDNRGKTALKSP